MSKDSKQIMLNEISNLVKFQWYVPFSYIFLANLADSVFISHHLTVLTIFIFTVLHYLTYQGIYLRPNCPFACTFSFHQVNISMCILDGSDCFESFNRWKHMKYISLGSIGFIEAEKLLERIKPLEPIGS